MRILILTNYWPPEGGAASRLVSELSEQLIATENQVVVVTGQPRYQLPSNYNATHKNSEEIYKNNIHVIRVPLPDATSPSPVRRGLDWIRLIHPFISGAKKAQNIDLVYTVMPPTTLAIAAKKASMHHQAPLVTMYGDLFPQNAIDLGMLKNPIAISLLRKLEMHGYKSADRIIVHADSYKEYIARTHTIDPEKIHVIYNWSDIEAVRPSEKHSQFRKQHDLANQFVVSYAGTMGPSQGLDTVIHTANLLKNVSNVRFVLAGTGSEKKHLQDLSTNLQLENVTFLDMLPHDQYVQLLQSSDICLITLDPKVVSPTVPSKMWQIMAAGRPIIAIVPRQCEVRTILQKAHAGESLDPGDPAKFAKTLQEALKYPNKWEEYGKSSRDFVVENASLKVCAAKYENVFRQAIAEKQHQKSLVTQLK